MENAWQKGVGEKAAEAESRLFKEIDMNSARYQALVNNQKKPK